MENTVTLDDLEFHETIGEGGYGTVNRVTFKKPFKGFTEAAAKSVRIISKKEVDIMRKLDHPNIVTLLAYFTKGPITLLILEFAKNGSVHDYLKDKTKPLSEALMQQWMQEAAIAIAYLHEQNFLHRDIKASNCLLFDSFILKLCDFGLARKLEHSQSTSDMKGTCRYLAPEIIIGNEEGRSIYSKPADIYSYGMLLLEIYTRVPPFQGIHQPQSVMFRVGKGKQPAIPADCPQLLSEMMKQCWKTNPRERPPIQTIFEAIPTIFSKIPKDTTEDEKTDIAIGCPVEEPGKFPIKTPVTDSGCGSMNCMNISGYFQMRRTLDTSKDSGIHDPTSSHLRVQTPATQWTLIQELSKETGCPVELSQVDGIAVGCNKDIIITDTADGKRSEERVLVLNSEGTLKHYLQSPSDEPDGRLQYPTKVAITSNDRILITDQSTSVKVFNPDGSFVKSFRTLPPDESCVNASVGIAVGLHDEAIVGDQDKQCITIHSQYGEFIKQIPTTITPFYLASNGNQLIIVSDWMLKRVIAMTRDGKVMFNIHRFTVEGMVGSPYGIACDCNDNVFIAVKSLDQDTGKFVPKTGHIHQYDNNGTFKRCIIRGMYGPYGLAISEGNMYVANTKSVLVYAEYLQE